MHDHPKSDNLVLCTSMHARAGKIEDFNIFCFSWDFLCFLWPMRRQKAHTALAALSLQDFNKQDLLRTSSLV